MKKTAFTVLALLISCSATAQLSESLAGYFDGPEGLLITNSERKAWKKITSDAEAEEFIALFWARRDPDLSTAVNEFRLDFEQRVEAADTLFGYDTTRGALSDRGRVLILLGSFWNKYRRAPGARASDVREPSDVTSDDSRMVPWAGLYQNQGETEIWEYRSGDLPVHVAQVFVNAIFLESEVGKNDYILDRSNGPLMHILRKMPEVLIKHPELTEAPQSGLIAGSRIATEDEHAWFDADVEPWPDTAMIFATAGLAPGPRHFIWVHLSLEDEISNAVSVVGRVRAVGSGEEIGSFVVPTADASIGGGAYQLSIPVEEGQWSLDVALATDAGPFAVTTVDVETARLQPGVASVSPFVWGTDAELQQDSKAGDPFNIGGWHVIPVLDDRFTTASAVTLNYMAYVFEPELAADGSPAFTVSISLSKDGKLVAKSPPQPAPLSRLGEGVWMFGRGLPLERFSQPGAYTLEVELVQTTDGAKGMVEIPFEMVDEASADESS